MQISDMLGQYNRNVSNSSTEELKGASGLQKMVSTVGELSVGNIFEGTVNSVRGSKVTLALSNGQVITAQLEGKVSLQVGMPMFFQVKSNDGGMVAIRPYSDGSNNGNPILLNALTTAGIPVNDRNLSMVDHMMREQMPIDKQSLLSMVRVVGMNPEVSVQTIVAMTKLGIPVTNELAAQFENYQNDHHAILNEMQQAMDEIVGQLGRETLTPEAAVKINQQILEIFYPSADVEKMDAGSAGENMQMQQAPGSVQEMVQEQAASWKPENMSDILREDAEKIQPEVTDAAQKNDAVYLGQVLSDAELEGLTKLLWNTPALMENETLFPQLPEEEVFVDTMGEEMQFAASTEAAAEEKPPVLNDSLTVKEFLQTVQKAFADQMEFGFAGIQKLFSSKEYQTILKIVMEQQWLIKPEELKSENKIHELYERLDRQMQQLESVMRASGVESTSFLQTATDIRNNIEFMNQINQIYTYVQLPLKMSGQNANGELYVYTNKKNLNNPDAEVSAFLHLDLEHLGSTDVSIKMQYKKVKTNFYLADDESYALVKQYLPVLDAALKKKGYQCTFSVSGEEKKIDFVKDYLRKDQPSAGVLHRYSFDVRT